MYWATLETRNFSFTAFGFTPEDALDTMRATWEEHARQTGANWTWEDVAEDVAITFTRVGDGWRDFDLLTNTNQPPKPKAVAHTAKPKRESKKMNQKAWLEYELKNIAQDAPSDYRNGYQDALTNALNNLGGMTPNTPDLASGYLPGEIKNQTLSPSTLRVIANDLEREGITGLNVALALDLIVGR